MIEWKSEPIGRRINGMTVKLYDSSDDMPMDVYFLSQQYGLMDLEAGSSLESINKRFQKLDIHLSSRQIDEAIAERKHLHQTFYNVLNKINFPTLQFGCYIHSVDGEKIDDHSDKNLLAIMTRMGKHGFTYKDLNATLEDIKKKFNRELKQFFPAKYGDSAKMNYLQQMKEKVIAELNYVITGEDRYMVQIKQIYEYFISLMKPKNIDWNSAGNVIVESKKLFEQLCITMMKDGITNPGQLSVMKFHIAVESYEKKTTPSKFNKP